MINLHAMHVDFDEVLESYKQRAWRATAPLGRTVKICHIEKMLGLRGIGRIRVTWQVWQAATLQVRVKAYEY